MIRNRRSRVDAMVLRCYIAAVLASRSQLDPPVTLKELHAQCLYRVSFHTIKRHRAWVRAEQRAGRLDKLAEWMRKARMGLPPDP